MNYELLHNSIIDHAHFSFSKSGGPGGQNVNKLNTKVELRISINELDGLTSVEHNRLESNCKNRLLADNILQFVVTEERSQLQNRLIAISHLESLIQQSIIPKKHRIATKPSRNAVKKRLNQKTIAGQKKRARNRPSESTD